MRTSGPDNLNPWMDRAARGDREAFGCLALAAQDRLFRFALAQGLYAADASEAVQETLLRVFARRSAWRPGADAQGWLLGFAMNVIREMRRRRRPRGLDAELLQDAQAHPPPEPEADEVDLKELAEALEALPPRQREAVACRYLREMTGRQTAEAMGCAEGTVRATLTAAMHKLRQRMRRKTHD